MLDSLFIKNLADINSHHYYPGLTGVLLEAIMSLVRSDLLRSCDIRLYRPFTDRLAVNPGCLHFCNWKRLGQPAEARMGYWPVWQVRDGVSLDIRIQGA